ncbi:serine hydrolase [uncultured Legionella sp.]|uniref:serine hydrolase domain-containing protein n=1 Tax=uncultured Legionella sp. TaxID=210934 RepID=UPI00260732D5|nr:serine hydrolase domain-containing protein [uncultured Legionella sp.]
MLCAADSKEDKGLKEQMQKIVNEYYKQYSDREQFTAVAASVLVPRDKKIDLNDIQTVVTGTMGYPPLNQKITQENLFDIGSITKSFTSMILLQLQAEDKLSLDDTLGKWLPQYPNWKEVTLRQLLNMTSSIPNYSEAPEVDKILRDDPGHVWTNEELLKYADPEKPLKVNKENYYEYCNSNYILAALVIEKVTQDSFENQLKKRILNSSHHLNTAYYPAGADGVAVGNEIKAKRVHGYYYDEKSKKVVDTIGNDLSWAGAAGAIVATTEDVVRWVQMLYHGTLIDSAKREKTLIELESVVSSKTGRPIATVTAEDPAGFGLGVAYRYDNESKQRFWFYEGSTLGFRVMYLWSPCNDVTTVVALNSKGAEGNPDSKMGDHIGLANQNLYEAVIRLHPELRCKPE